MSCRGGVTTSPGHRPRPAWCRTAPARCRTAARRPPSMCLRRGGTPWEPARRPSPRTRARRVLLSAPYPGDGSYIASPSYPPTGSSPYPASGQRARSRAAGLSPARFLVVSGPARAVPRLDPAQHARSSRRPDRAWPGHPGRAGHSDDTGGLAAAGSGLRPALGASPRDRAASQARRIRIGPGAAELDGNSEIKGLPRRVRQASLAPQLRDNPPQRRTTVASSGPAAGLTGRVRPRSARPCRRFSAAGRRAARSGRPTRLSRPPGPSGADPSAGGGADDSTTDEEARGNSHGS